MGDSILFFFLLNLITFSLLFWALLVISSYFYKVKNHTNKKHFCECGFKSLSDINIQININFTMLCIFLVLYDVEFTFLFPILFNIIHIHNLQIIIIYIFIILVLCALYYDYQMNAMSWQL